MTLERSEYRAELQFCRFDLSVVETHKSGRGFGKVEEINPVKRKLLIDEDKPFRRRHLHLQRHAFPFLCIITLSSKGTSIETVAPFEQAGSGWTIHSELVQCKGPIFYIIAKCRISN